MWLPRELDKFKTVTFTRPRALGVTCCASSVYMDFILLSCAASTFL